MNDMVHTETVPTPTASVRRGVGPAIALAVLAPVVAEVLSGATRLSYIFVLLPEIMVWGCGAVLIREMVRRWRGGWKSILLLGLGLSIAEEFVIQQTSLAPLPWPGASNCGRLWGVNWTYFLFMLGYESVWVVLVPVRVAELIFSRRRHELWLGKRGLIVSSVLFLIGSYIAWFAWTQRARPVVFHAPVYRPPLLTVLLGLLAILVLTFLAYRLAVPAREENTAPNRRAPWPWLVFLLTLVLGFPWDLLMVFTFGSRPTLPLSVAMVCGLVWAALTYAVVHIWISSAAWSDMHTWALVFAATVVCMASGFAGSNTWPHTDLIFKAVLNVLAVAGFVLLAWKIRQRRPQPSELPRERR